MRIKPIIPKKWKVNAPPSKSFTNRALLIAGLAKGKSILFNPLYCDDSKYMLKALNKFGIKTEKYNDKIIVYGKNGLLEKPKSKIFTGNAGTAFRFLTTASSLSKGNVILDGDERMRQRPIMDLIDSLKLLGVNVETTAGFAPLNISGGGIKGGKTSIKGSKSSQYISSILISAPYADKKIILSIDGVLTSIPYIDITLDIMHKFGIKVENDRYKQFVINPEIHYKATRYQIEGDASNASYFFAAAAITGSEIEVFNLPRDSKQGDLRFVDLLSEMGCFVNRKKNSIIVKGGDLKGITTDMNDCPDVVPTLAVVAAFAKGKTTIKNVANLRIKECDRIKAVCTELSKIGIKTIEQEDGLAIIPGNMHGAEIDTYNDHRIAMSFSIAGLMIKNIFINNPACVKKSFPDYWKVFKKVFYS